MWPITIHNYSIYHVNIAIFNGRNISIDKKFRAEHSISVFRPVSNHFIIMKQLLFFFVGLLFFACVSVIGFLFTVFGLFTLE